MLQALSKNRALPGTLAPCHTHARILTQERTPAEYLEFLLSSKSPLTANTLTHSVVRTLAVRDTFVLVAAFAHLTHGEESHETKTNGNHLLSLRQEQEPVFESLPVENQIRSDHQPDVVKEGQQKEDPSVDGGTTLHDPNPGDFVGVQEAEL